MNKIQQQLIKNRKLLKSIDKLSIKISISSNKQRDLLLIGFFRNSLTHYLSIIILIEKELYNSAFALIRILFDSIIRAEYMYYKFDDERIQKFYDSGNWDSFFRGQTLRMCEYLDDKYDFNFYTSIKKNTYKMMCDYTHTGVNQIARNYNQDKCTIESTFDKKLILDTLVGINKLIQISSQTLFLNIGLKQNQITEKEINDYMAICTEVS